MRMIFAVSDVKNGLYVLDVKIFWTNLRIISTEIVVYVQTILKRHSLWTRWHGTGMQFPHYFRFQILPHYYSLNVAYPWYVLKWNSWAHVQLQVSQLVRGQLNTIIFMPVSFLSFYFAIRSVSVCLLYASCDQWHSHNFSLATLKWVPSHYP